MKFQDADKLFFRKLQCHHCIWEWDVVVDPSHQGGELLCSHIVQFLEILAHSLLLCLESLTWKMMLVSARSELLM
jgi:hypothetical protein